MSEAYVVRPVNARKDISQIPDLIESGFHRWLDSDSLSFIRSMRENAASMKKHPVTSRLLPLSFPMEGVVCEANDGKLIGNISVFDVEVNGVKSSLIANVCVDSEHRGEHIASQMLDEVFALCRSKKSDAIYLQVRRETGDAVEMYLKRGFEVTDERDSWICPKNLRRKGEPIAWLNIEEPDRSDKNRFESLFARAYPKTVTWNLGYQPGLFPFSGMDRVKAKIDNVKGTFKTVSDPERGVLAWFAVQPTESIADNLWLIPNEACDEGKLIEVLRLITQTYGTARALTVNVAHDSFSETLKEAGFARHNHLLWMKKSL